MPHLSKLCQPTNSYRCQGTSKASVPSSPAYYFNDFQGSHPKSFLAIRQAPRNDPTLKRRSRAHYWFPGLDNAVRMHVESCHQCQVHSTMQQRYPCPVHQSQSRRGTQSPLICSAHYLTILISSCADATYPAFLMQK